MKGETEQRGDFINKRGEGSVSWLEEKEAISSLSFISKVSALNFLTHCLILVLINI